MVLSFVHIAFERFLGPPFLTHSFASILLRTLLQPIFAHLFSFSRFHTFGSKTVGMVSSISKTTSHFGTPFTLFLLSATHPISMRLVFAQ